MIFTNPSLLWAALGILVPLAIHFWSKKNEETVKIGSIKLLKKSELARSSSIRPNELWLLLLRVLTILLLALFLAGPQLKSPVKPIPITYLVEPSLLHSDQLESVLDTLPPDATYMLADGFPAITDYDENAFQSTPPNYWQLVQEMDALPSDSILVFTKALVSGVRGMRPQTDKAINFVIVADENASEQVLNAQLKSDSVALLTMRVEGKGVTFKTKKVSKVNKEIKINQNADSITVAGHRLPLQGDTAFNVLLAYEERFLQEVRYIKAAYKAISIYLDKDIVVDSLKVNDLEKNTDSITSNTYDFLVWLGKTPIENDSVPLLRFLPDAMAGSLIVAGNSEKEYWLTERLNSENVTSEHLAEKLLMLLPLHQNLKNEIIRFDERSMTKDAFEPEFLVKTNTNKTLGKIDISPWLLAFLMPIMIAERILAKYRKQ